MQFLKHSFSKLTLTRVGILGLVNEKLLERREKFPSNTYWKGIGIKFPWSWQCRVFFLGAIHKPRGQLFGHF